MDFIEKARERLAETLAEADEIGRLIAMYERFSEENVLGPNSLSHLRQTTGNFSGECALCE